jgi:5-methylcytosine-specific restriction endonuclease McrA
MFTNLPSTGKKSREWLQVRREWIKANPPNHEGAYLCGICGKPVHESQVELDHIDGRVGDDFSDWDNIQPSHRYCNQLKGSKKWKPKVSKQEYELRKELDL